MTDTITTQYGDLTVWTTADPQSLPAASSAMMTSVANALDGAFPHYATAALLLADSPTETGYYFADDAPGGQFYWSGSAWSLFGNPDVASTGLITPAVAGWIVSVSGVKYRYSGSTWQTWISTGWTTLTSFSGSWAAGADAPSYTVRNGVASLRGLATLSSGSVAIGGTATILTIPTGFRPTVASHFSMMAQNENRFGWVVVNTDGTVVVTNASASPGTVTSVRFADLIFPIF
jgi:hypothetical protein